MLALKVVRKLIATSPRFCKEATAFHSGDHYPGLRSQFNSTVVCRPRCLKIINHNYNRADFNKHEQKDSVPTKNITLTNKPSTTGPFHVSCFLHPRPPRLLYWKRRAPHQLTIHMVFMLYSAYQRRIGVATTAKPIEINISWQLSI